MKGWHIVGLVCGLVHALCPAAEGEGAAPPAQSGLSAWDTLAGSPHLREGERILGMVGFFGQPRPAQWLVLTDDRGIAGSLREVVVARGGVPSERRFAPLPGQDLPDIPLEQGIVQIDSDEAFAIAESEAKRRQRSFESAHYQLRCREAQREPVWMLSLLDASQVSVGTLYISAITGELLRSVWAGTQERKLTGSPAEGLLRVEVPPAAAAETDAGP